MSFDTVQVHLGERSYSITIGVGAIEALPPLLHSLKPSQKIGVVTDTNVGPLYGDEIREQIKSAGFEASLCVIPAGEPYKKLAVIEGICQHFLQAGLDRNSVILALGGGVVGDVAGFAAGVYMRGIRFIQIPTTVVAQVDSSVGGKTGVNLAEAKNIIGVFHQPSGVIIDLRFLESLPDRELRAGLAEVIKHGVIADPELFTYMEHHAEAILNKDLSALLYPIKRSCEIKSAIVESDEREQGLRANLNYGHTFGHGIEAATQYELFLHGEAVALGMMAAAALAKELGLVTQEFVDRQKHCLKRYELPTCWKDIPISDVMNAMKHDKKARSGKLKFILPKDIGKVIQYTEVTEKQAENALKTLQLD